MRGWMLLLLAATAVFAADDLSGEIRGGQPRKLVDLAMPLLDEGDAIFRSWILEEIPEADVVDRLRRAIACYDEASALLQRALDIEYDPGVNHRLMISNRRLQKLRFRVHFQQPRAAPVRPPAPGPAEQPPPPAPVEAPVPEPDDTPPPPPAFAPGAPPAVPVDAELASPGAAGPESAKADERAIRALLKDYYEARKPSKLLFRHRLCQGKGTFRDGSVCAECGGTGRQINLFHFRKAFWGVFSPELRAAPGSLEALQAFLERARKDASLLEPLVKSFRIVAVEPQGYWARVTVEENTEAGKLARSFALIGVGQSWYFYTPATDSALVWQGEGP